jgi:glucose/arabinose dehydrogenase
MTTVRQLVALVAAFGLGVSAARAQSIQPGTISARLKLIATVTNSANGGPTFGVHSPDPRFLYVGQQNGNIRILNLTQPTPLPDPPNFLNFDALFGTGLLVDDTGTGERGMLGAAFHPDFNTTGAPGFRKFYTFTTETIASATPHFVNPLEPPTGGFPYNSQSVIREWTARAPNPFGVQIIDTSIPSRVVMRIGKPGPFHNGGALAFGPDNMLYVSLGDGGGGGQNGGNDGGNDFNAYQGHTNPGNPDTGNLALGGWNGQGNAQDRRNVYGSILRIKPTLDADPGTIPSPIAGAGWRIPIDNPFTAESNAMTPISGWQDNWVDEIWAYGFRNPFRMSFDPVTGKLYAADVGQDRNTISREEVDVIVRGGNYGWVVKSGDQINNRPLASPTNTVPPPNNVTLIDPIAQYETTQLGQGGLAAIGGFVYRGDNIPGLVGQYVFGDLNRNTPAGGRLLYSGIAEPGLNTVFELNITGAVPKPAGSFLHGVAEDGNGEIYFLFGNGQVMKLVPEPSGGALALVAGLAAIAARRRRRAL